MRFPITPLTGSHRPFCPPPAVRAGHFSSRLRVAISFLVLGFVFGTPLWSAQSAELNAQDGAVLENADPVKGEALYKRRCGACHSLEANRVGPKHRGVYGRTAGSLADYRYSPALAQSDLVWGAATLNLWLGDPQALIPGQRMGFRLGNLDERRDIIAYLRQVSAP